MSDAYFTEIEGVPEGVNEQLRALVSQVNTLAQFSQLGLGIIPPPKPQDRQQIYADGVYWNPTGYGKGPHYYDAQAIDEGYDFGTNPNRGVIPAWGASLSTGFAVNILCQRLRAAAGDELFVYGNGGGRVFLIGLTSTNQVRMVIQPLVNGSEAELDITHPVALVEGVDYFIRAFHSGDSGSQRAGININGNERAVTYDSGSDFAQGAEYLMASDTATLPMQSCSVYSISMRDLASVDSRHYEFDQIATGVRIEDIEGGAQNLGEWDNPIAAEDIVSRVGRWLRYAETTSRGDDVAKAVLYKQAMATFGATDDAAAGSVIGYVSAPFPGRPTPATVSVASDNVNDTNGGSGASVVRIIGVDSDFNEIKENVVMNGTTPVLTTQVFAFINEAFVTTAGTTTTANTGLISLTFGGITVAIPPEQGDTDFAAVMIPRPYIPGTVACVLNYTMSMGRSVADAYMIFAAYLQRVDEGRRLQTRVGVQVGGTSTFNKPLPVSAPYEPGDLIWVQTDEISATTNVFATASLSIAWLKPQEE